MSKYFIHGFITATFFITLNSTAQQPLLHVVEDVVGYRISLVENGQTLLSSPPEGLWSIAFDWQDDWPSDWRHAQATEYKRFGDWHILKGQLNMPNGEWRLADSYIETAGLVKCVRRFEWHGAETLENTTLSVRFHSPGQGKDVLLPGILYYGNPSGAKSGRTPVYSGAPGEEAIFEEHRFPMPFAALEWSEGGRIFESTLFSLPAPTQYGALPDQWWSLGVRALPDGTEFVLYSGPTAANGERSVVKALQHRFLAYENAVLNIPPGAVIEKTFYLQAGAAERGAGFRPAVQAGLDIFKPELTAGLPAVEDIVKAKYGYAKTRYIKSEKIAGFKKYVDRDFFVFGWCGQAAAPGYALQVLVDDVEEPAALDMAQNSLDFLSEVEFYDQGFRTWYSIKEKQWQPREDLELLSQGQAMLSFADAVRVGRNKDMQTEKWEAFLKKACDVHAERILSPNWQPLSTNEAFFIAPLCKGFELFGVQTWQDAAEKAGRVYADRHLTMQEPYWGGTLDASCEDKEGAWAAFQGFLALYEMTGEDSYLQWARHACDVMLTYFVVWNIDMPAGRLRNHDFKTVGWTAVSVQNMHLDVYGVLFAPAVARLGQITGDERLVQLALLMFKSCGQLIDAYGSQGEQIQQTNYAQNRSTTDVFSMRGYYVEEWTVFWITAHFLNAAAQFKEMGIWK